MIAHIYKETFFAQWGYLIWLIEYEHLGTFSMTDLRWTTKVKYETNWVLKNKLVLNCLEIAFKQCG